MTEKSDFDTFTNEFTVKFEIREYIERNMLYLGNVRNDNNVFTPQNNEKSSNLSRVLNEFWECSGGNRDGRIDFSMYSIIYRNIFKLYI